MEKTIKQKLMRVVVFIAIIFSVAILSSCERSTRYQIRFYHDNTLIGTIVNDFNNPITEEDLEYIDSLLNIEQEYAWSSKRDVFIASDFTIMNKNYNCYLFISFSDKELVENAKKKLIEQYTEDLTGVDVLPITLENDITITWTASSTAISINEKTGELTIVQKDVVQEVTLKATIVKGNAVEYVHFIYNVPAYEESTQVDPATSIIVDNIPAGATLSVQKITDNNTLETYIEKVKLLNNQNTVLQAFDISLGGIQPTNQSLIKIPLSNLDASKAYAVYSLENGTLENTKAIQESGYLTFAVSHFSVFLVVGLEEEISSESKTVTISQSNTNFGGTYSTTPRTTTIDGITYACTDTMTAVEGDKTDLQVKKNSGQIYNTTSLGKIVEIVVVLRTAKDFSLTAGNNAKPSTNINGTLVGTTYTFDLSNDNYDYFMFTNGAGVGYVKSIKITYLAEGGNQPQLPQLKSPTNLKIEEKNLTFDSVSEATKYWIYDGTEVIGETNVTEFDLSNIKTIGNHIISVIAVGDKVNYLNSNKSTSVIYTVSPSGGEDTYEVEIEFTYVNNGFDTSTEGISQQFSNTYTGIKNQITKSNTLTITIWGIDLSIAGVDIKMHTNTSNGAGSITIKVGDNALVTNSPVGKGSTGNTTTPYLVSYQADTPLICDQSKKIVITVTSSENSLYIDGFTIIGTAADWTDEQVATADLNNLEIPSTTRNDIDLPLIGKYGSNIEWLVINGKEQYLNNLGQVNQGDNDEIVIIRATADYNGTSVSKTFTITVRGKINTNPDLPAYYDGITALAGETLKSQLRSLITTTHTKITSYSDCGTYLPYSDVDPNNPNNMLLFYTGESVPRNYGNWNREHVWPQSLGWFSTSGAGADMHHIRPCEIAVNSARSNYKFGISSGYYLPTDQYKGDVARIIFYMLTRYNQSDSYGVKAVAQSMDLLLAWNELDPVSEHEILRNNYIANFQGNRNPYIDNQHFADLIWG